MTNIINTEIEAVSVIIDDVEYQLAENTIALRDKLKAAYKATNGKERHEKHLAELEVLLGKTAVKKIFSSGKNENIDRIYRIHSGVVMAFNRNHFDTDAEIAENNMASMNESIKPMNQLLENALKISKVDK